MSRAPNQKVWINKVREKRMNVSASVDCKRSASQIQRSSKVVEHSNILPSKSSPFNSIFDSSVELENVLDDFRLPDFSKAIRRKLKHRIILNNEEKKIIMEDLGEAIRNFTCYPLVAQLCKVIEIFLEKYPHLLETCAPDISKRYWIHLLQEHFVVFGMKMTKKMINRGQEKRFKRIEFYKEKVDKMTQTKNVVMFGNEEKVDKMTQANLHAVYQDLSLVIQEMKKEWLKPVRNMQVIECLMRTTYDTRRNFIVHETPTIYVMKERYPALFDVAMIKKEFTYNTGKDQAVVFNTNLMQFSDVIFNLPGVDKIIKKEISISFKKQKHFDERFVPILLIPSLLGENLDFLCFSNRPFNKDELLPWIECNATLQEVLKGIGVYRIFAENILICEPSDLIEAVFCLVACYWVFFISYPSKSSKTFQIFETFFLEIEEYFEEEETSLDEDVVKLADILKGLHRKKIKTK